MTPLGSDPLKTNPFNCWKPVVGHEEYLECTATGAFRKKQTKHEYKLQTHYGRLYLHVYQQGKSHCFPAYLLITRSEEAHV